MQSSNDLMSLLRGGGVGIMESSSTCLDIVSGSLWRYRSSGLAPRKTFPPNRPGAWFHCSRTGCSHDGAGGERISLLLFALCHK